MEETHYNPFGLVMAGISSKANKETFYSPNKNKFVNQELISDLDIETYLFRYRTYDLQIGRFYQSDPLSDKYVYNSQFAYAENKVINGIDLEGLEWIGLPLLGNSTTIVRNPIVENVLKPTVEAGNKAAEVTNEVSKGPSQEHHYGPREFKNDPVVQSARRAGFKFEGKENKGRYATYDKTTGKGQHGNHPKYNNEFFRRLSDFKENNPNYTDKQALEFMRNTVKDLKETINNNPQTKINDLFKGLIVPVQKDGVIQGLPDPALRGPVNKVEEKKSWSQTSQYT